VGELELEFGHLDGAGEGKGSVGDLVAVFEVVAGIGGHESAGGGIEGQPAAQEAAHAGVGVWLHQGSTGGLDVEGDVDCGGEEHGDEDGESLHHQDPEVFLVGGEEGVVWLLAGMRKVRLLPLQLVVRLNDWLSLADVHLSQEKTRAPVWCRRRKCRESWQAGAAGGGVTGRKRDGGWWRGCQACRKRVQDRKSQARALAMAKLTVEVDRR
jgi:hypothetical protein